MFTLNSRVFCFYLFSYRHEIFNVFYLSISLCLFMKGQEEENIQEEHFSKTILDHLNYQFHKKSFYFF